MKEADQKLVIAFGVLVLVALAGASIAKAPSKAGAAADAGPDGPSAASAEGADGGSGGAGSPGTLLAADLFGGVDAGGAAEPMLEAVDTTGSDRRARTGVGSKMPDGTPVPPLPEKAPRSVHFGVVMVSYAGAQGAQPNARSHQDASDLATKLAAEAKTDFHAAVAHADSGSADDVGRVPRGVLELAPEYALFTLPPGGVSDPVDTPRGFWIVRRIE